MLPVFRRLFSALMLLVIAASTVPHLALAANSSYAALRVTTTGNGSIAMAPGEVKNITVTFQNTGSVSWKNDGPGYVSLYTYGPKYRKSSFDPGTWLSPSQVKRIIEPSVPVGGTGTVTFALHAPATPGKYTETFNLASEDITWIAGGEFTLSINVDAATSLTPSTSSTSSSDGYAAKLTVKSADRLKVPAGKTISFTAVFQNTGSKTWSAVALDAPDVSVASTTGQSFAHSSWDHNRLATLSGQSVAPGQSVPLQFFFAAPRTNGVHTAKFQLVANDIDVPDAFVEIPVEVTGGAPAALDAPIREDAPAEDTANYIDEPIIRVGVLIVDEETDDEVYITSYDSDFELRDTSGKLLGEYTKGTKVRAAYEGGHYAYGAGGTSAAPLRFVPKTYNAVMTITNFDRRITRGSIYANNTFRNVLEVRFNSVKNRTWVINELKMEEYLKGLAETSNLSHQEFQKALLTAARTYAFYHWERATKHDDEGYHVDAYLDQVYWGYDQEARTPNMTASIEATRGQIVTYQGKTAITPYFSRSDGRTRDWSDVWGGDVPWVKGVSVPCDAGKTLWGHGVGMSASGALCMANQGQLWDQILHYFYTDIDIIKHWK